MTKAYIALGTNIEPRETHFIKALERLTDSKEVEIKNISSIYETEPVGYTDQADFLNMLVEIETSLEPIQLLDHCQEIENHLGRERLIRFGPRTIDLDILLYGNESMDIERLTIPHPRMHERAFVLVPLVDLDKDLHIPGVDGTVEELLKLLPESDKAGVKSWPRHA